MCNTCDNSEAPVKRIEISVPPGDFWRSNSGADLPDQNNDHTEAISHNGPVAIGVLDPTTGKLLTVAGDVDIQGQIDPNSIVFSDAPAGVTTAWDSISSGYYLIGVIGTQRPMVAMPKTDMPKVFQVRRADGTTVVLNVDTLYQRVGVNTDDAKAALDVAGAVIHRQLTLTDFVANGAIGTAAATVDATSVISLEQTTAGVTVTLPAPTNTQAGRLLLVENNGTTPITVDTTPITNGKMTAFVWSGIAWIPLAASGGGSGSTEDFWRSGTAASLLIPDGVNDFTETISHNGNMGLGLADPSQVAARLDANGAQVLRPVSLPNFAADGSIGTAAATVDIASTITVNQTTANIDLTLPNPTNAQQGRILSVVNIGTAQIKVAGVYVNPGQGASWIWAGGWRLIGEQPDFTIVGASRNVTIGDYLKTLLAATAVTLTVPANLGYMVFRIRQSTNAGVITMAAGAGVTLVAPYGASTFGLAGDYKIVEIINNVCYVG